MQKIFLRGIVLAVLLIVIFTGCSVLQGNSSDIPLINDKLELVWSYESGGAINHPPIIVDDLVIFIPQNGNLTALDTRSGNLRWQFESPQKVWERSYSTDGKIIFIGLEGGSLVAIDARS